MTFMTRGVNGTNELRNVSDLQTIGEIRGYGDVWWTMPYSYGKTDHMYTFDAQQNVTFPKNVIATKFVGEGSSLTGLNGSNITQGTIGAARIANLDTSKITSGILPVTRGGTGQASLNDAANSFLNSLSVGTSTPEDEDYYISQYVNGGTTTTTYHKRPMSTLWTYIKNKISSVLGLTASTYNGSAAKVNEHTVESDVPSNAVFTDTTYSIVTTSEDGLMSTSDKNRLDNVMNVVASSTQPTNQQSGDIWLVLSSD